MWKHRKNISQTWLLFWQPIFCVHRAFLLCFLLLFLCGCKVEVYRGIDEQQANAMLSALLKNGVAAAKQDMGKAGYTIFVPKRKLSESLELLREYGFPKEHYQNIGNIFTGEGMVSSSTEEQARLAYAISQELSDTLSRISGVLSARVHIALAGVNQDLEEHRTFASAAILLLHTPNSLVTSLESKIRELVSMSVPELAPEKVSVVFSPVREMITIPLGGMSSSMNGLFFSNGRPSGLFIFLGIIIVTMLGVLVWLHVQLCKSFWIEYQKSLAKKTAKNT